MESLDHSPADSGSMEPDEPIFDIAAECESLFTKQLKELHDCDDQDGAKMVLELNQGFIAWAASLGVFAESHLCLDHKLRQHVEIKDQLLRLLDIMQRNLTHLFEPGQHSERMNAESNGGNQLSSSHPRLSIPSLEAISEAVGRLNTFGNAIQRSSLVSQAIKARPSTETFGLSSFQNVAYLSIQALYGDANPSLLKQLAQSMTETYARFLRKKPRKAQFHGYRPRIQISDPLYQILKKASVDVVQTTNMNDLMPDAETPHLEPSSVDRRELGDKKSLNFSLSNTTTYILENLIEYPRPAKGSLICDWCSRPITADLVEEDHWRQHVNEDNEPYVCLSENCSEPLPRFANSREWFQHMRNIHGYYWHQEVHVPSSWVCPLCTEEDMTFSKSNDLAIHFDKVHETVFTQSQLRAITQQSRVQISRPQDSCPLCCLPIKTQLDYPPKPSEEYNNEMFMLKLSEDTSSSSMSSLETIGNHVAAHLQSIMLLTLRLSSINGAEDNLNNDKSTKGYTTFDSLSVNVYWQLYNNLERKDDPNLRFAANGTAERVLHADLLIRLFQSLVSADSSAVQQFGLDEYELADRIDIRKLHAFLAVLLFASCGIEAARIFTKELVARNEWPAKGRATGKDIHKLPATREDLLYLFKDGVTVDKFCSSQTYFNTVVIRMKQEVVVNLTSQRLPYLEEEQLGSGSFGKVFKVKIARGHLEDTQHGTLNPTAVYVARKDYITTVKFDGEKERHMMERILMGAAHKCENIMENFGSLRIGTNAYSLFMPCAICDLSDYMMKYHPSRRVSIQEKAQIILSAKGLAEGLDFLHNDMKSSDKQDMICYYIDLKPSNVLIFRDTDPAYSGKERLVWKLSDFSMTRVKYQKRGDTIEQEEMDFKHSFLPLTQPEPERPSATQNRRGEGTYLPPESLTSTRAITTASDVWSLGCVLSVVFTYLEDGGEGVESYQTRRLQHPDSDGYDYFFIRGRRFTPYKNHPEVNKTHTQLIDKAGQRQAEEKHAVQYILRYLERGVLVLDYKKRDGIKTVKEKLSHTYAYFKSMPPVENRSAGEHQSWVDKFRDRQIRSKYHPPSSCRVEILKLSPTKVLEGCDISPKGDLIAYWGDTKIKLYKELSLLFHTNSRGALVSSHAAEYTLGLTGCIWESVAVTDRYLIASTTGSAFQCFIYDLIFVRQYRITLPLPEISRLAVSPDSKMLACVIQSKDEGDECGSVFFAPIEELIEEFAPSTYGSSGNENEGSLSRRGLPRAKVRLDWSAGDITHISFRSHDEVYLIVQPQITVESRENEISIIHLSLRTRLLRTVLVRSQGFDPGNTVGHFTPFTAFRQQEATFAFITQGKQLYIQNLADPETNAIKKSIKDYRILKLVMDWNDRKIFALGTLPSTHQVYLLEIAVPQSEADQVSVIELAPLPEYLSDGDDFIQVLASRSSKDGGDYILIASVPIAGPCRIYRISLPDS